MFRSIVGKVAWVGRTASMVFGLALVMALVFGVATTALSATGGNFILVKGNSAGAASKLTANVAGPAFNLINNSTAAAATALNLTVPAGKAPLTVNATAGTATNLSADKLDGKSAEDLAQLDPSTAQNGSLRVNGMVRSGSETGTSQPSTLGIGDKYDGVMTRRIVSTDRTAGSVIARTDDLRLERDGTVGGLRIAWDANTETSNTATCALFDIGYGAGARYLPTANGVPIGGTLAGSVPIITDGDGAAMVDCMFGDPLHSGHTTEVSMHRKYDDSSWVGTVTSTVNQ